MGLILKDEDAFAPFIQGVSLPLLLLSGVLLPMSLAPTWLKRVSQVNPLSHVVDASRQLFHGNFGSSTVAWGTSVTVVLAGAAGLVGHPHVPAACPPKFVRLWRDVREHIGAAVFMSGRVCPRMTLRHGRDGEHCTST